MGLLRGPSGSIYRLVALLLVLVGGPFLVLGLHEAATTRRQLDTFSTARGTVVGNTYQEGGGEDGSGAYYPVVEFKPEDARPVRFSDGVGTLPPDYDLGASVVVLYDRQNPNDARIHSWKRLWLMPTLFTGIGLLILLVPVALWALSFRGPR
jgi:hypothetical protein